jgi:hypothetical protein
VSRDYLNRVTYMTPDGTLRHVTYAELVASDADGAVRKVDACGAQDAAGIAEVAVLVERIRP